MQITIDHCHYTPKWETIQQVIREATNKPNGRLVKIERADGKCDYRQPGTYHLGFEQNNTTILPITLEVLN